MLFADDMMLISTDPLQLQTLLNTLHTYTNKWGLQVNINKTKICVFRKRKTPVTHKWSYNGLDIEVVDEFCYLWMKFVYNGNLKTATKTLSDQALKAVNSLHGLFRRISLDINMKISLFDTMVTPILLYGAEVWGLNDFQDADKIHIKFCKTILGVRPHTPNAAILGELARYPLSVMAKETALKYWIKLVSDTNSLGYKLYTEQCHELVVNPRRNHELGRQSVTCAKSLRIWGNVGQSAHANT